MKKQKYQVKKQYGNYLILQDYFVCGEWVYNVKQLFPANTYTLSETILTNNIEHDRSNNISNNANRVEHSLDINK